MKSGDILLFEGEDGFSRLIAWGTNSKYTHVAICASSEMNIAIEATAGGGLDIVPDISKSRIIEHIKAGTR